jgi:hypothetical protein
VRGRRFDDRGDELGGHGRSRPVVDEDDTLAFGVGNRPFELVEPRSDRILPLLPTVGEQDRHVGRKPSTLFERLTPFRRGHDHDRRDLRGGPKCR